MSYQNIMKRNGISGETDAKMRAAEQARKQAKEAAQTISATKSNRCGCGRQAAYGSTRCQDCEESGISYGPRN